MLSRRPRYSPNAELGRILTNEYWQGPLLVENSADPNADLHAAALLSFEHLARFAAESLYTEKQREIDFCLTASTHLNAFAYASTDQEPTPYDFIAVCGGAIWTAFDLFNRVFAHPGNFPHVGNAALETAPSPTNLTTNVLAGNHKIILPRCPIRRVCAVLFTEICTNLLFAHELTHLQQGHLEFVRETYGQNHIDERDAPESIEFRRNRQALEMAADTGAVRIVIEWACRKAAFLHPQLQSLPEEVRVARTTAFGNFETTINSVSLALYMHYRNFDNEWQWWNADAATHPLPAMRMVASIFNIQAILATHTEHGYEPERFLKNSDKIIAKAEEAFALITGEPVNDKMIKSVAGTRLSTDEAILLRSHWASLKPSLRQYRRGPIYGG